MADPLIFCIFKRFDHERTSRVTVQIHVADMLAIMGEATTLFGDSDCFSNHDTPTVRVEIVPCPRHGAAPPVWHPAGQGRPGGVAFLIRRAISDHMPLFHHPYLFFFTVCLAILLSNRNTQLEITLSCAEQSILAPNPKQAHGPLPFSII